MTARRARLASPALAILMPVYVFLGAMFVAVDLSTVAFAAHFGHKALAGFILGTYALGSATGGLWYGARTWKSPPARRLAVTLTLTVAGVCTFWAMPDLAALTGLIFLCGLTIAPTLIAGYSLLESTVRPGQDDGGHVVADHRDLRRGRHGIDGGRVHPGRARPALRVRLGGLLRLRGGRPVPGAACSSPGACRPPECRLRAARGLPPVPPPRGRTGSHAYSRAYSSASVRTSSTYQLAWL